MSLQPELIGRRCVIRNCENPLADELTGVIRAFNPLYGTYAVELDPGQRIFIYAHDCNGACPNRNGYFVSPEEMELLEPKPAGSIGAFLHQLRSTEVTA